MDMSFSFLVEDFCNPRLKKSGVKSYWSGSGWINPLRFRYRIRYGLCFDVRQNEEVIYFSVGKNFILKNENILLEDLGEPSIQGPYFICEDYYYIYFQDYRDLTYVMLKLKG